MKTVAGFVGYIWALWASIDAGLTTFLYLAGEAGFESMLAYFLSLLALTPVLGPLAATFMAPAVWDWTWLHAAFNFLGGYLLLMAAGIGRGQRLPQPQ